MKISKISFVKKIYTIRNSKIPKGQTEIVKSEDRLYYKLDKIGKYGQLRYNINLIINFCTYRLNLEVHSYHALKKIISWKDLYYIFAKNFTNGKLHYNINHYLFLCQVTKF